MRIAVQVNNYRDLGCTTIYLCQEALERGYEVFFYTTLSLSLEDGKVVAIGKKLKEVIEVFEQGLNICKFFDETEIVLNHFDFVLMRNDPPLNMQYITSTYILERCGTLVINNPKAVRDFPEKFVDYANWTFPTLISADINRIEKFCMLYSPFILKPLHGFGGSGILKFDNFDTNAKSAISEMLAEQEMQIVVQEFCPKVFECGDKRVVVLDGKVIGCFARKNESGFLMNMCRGGNAMSCRLTHKEEEICFEVASDLKKNDIMLAGIDMIDEKVTEINVTSIAGVLELNQLYHMNTAKICFDKFEEKLYAFRTKQSIA